MTAQAPSPFGWTGIKSERYTRWNGKLDGRKKIVTRMVSESVLFNLKTAPVVILIVLSWVFSMMFPVLEAASGFLPLEATVPDTYDGTQPTMVVMNQAIVNTSQAQYELKGAVFTNKTQFAIENVRPGWTAYMNTSGSETQIAESLIVIPPLNARPGEMDFINVTATTRGREDKYKTLTIIAPNKLLASQRMSYDLDFSSDVFNGTAGGSVDSSFMVNNTGTFNDTYNITIGAIPNKWSMAAFVNGTQAKVTFKTIEGGEGFMRISIRTASFSIEVPAGQGIKCVLKFTTRQDSAKNNGISVTINSRGDPLVMGNYFMHIGLSDTKKADLTGTIVYDSIMGNVQVLFTLLLAAVVGSKMIATDLNEKSYNLYFARPLSKKDYIIGKFATLGSLLALVTVVPALISYTLLILLNKISGTYLVDHLWTWGAIIGYSLVTILTLTTLSLAFSSITSRRFYAAAALVVIYLVTSIMGQVAAQAFNSVYARLISFPDDIGIVGQMAFKLGDTLNLPFDWRYSLAVLVVIWFVCSFMVWFKVEKTEISE